MRLLPNIEDEMRGRQTYELPDGRRVKVCARDVEEFGLTAVMRSMGLDEQDQAGRLPVLQDGVMIGTLSADFNPARIVSRSLLYDPRRGDIVRDGSRWIAATSLGMGDLEAIADFKPA